MNKLFEKILVSIEPSKEWKIFLNSITSMFPDSFFHILSVIDTTKFLGRGIRLYEDYISDLIENSMKEYEEILNKKGAKYEINIRKGRVVSNVFDLANKENINLIIIGSHSALGVKRLKLGGIAKEILINSHIPVLIMNSLIEPPKTPKILNPTTGSPFSYEASMFALNFAKNFNSILTVLYLIKNESEANEYFNKIKVEAEKLNVSVNFKITEDDPLKSILDNSKENDLIIGSRGYKGFKYRLRFFIKEFSLDYIVRSTVTLSEKPVLLICD
ncbi:MAG: universal stress protein [Caldisericia bacterium]